MATPPTQGSSSKKRGGAVQVKCAAGPECTHAVPTVQRDRGGGEYQRMQSRSLYLDGDHAAGPRPEQCGKCGKFCCGTSAGECLKAHLLQCAVRSPAIFVSSRQFNLRIELTPGCISNMMLAWVFLIHVLPLTKVWPTGSTASWHTFVQRSCCDCRRHTCADGHALLISWHRFPQGIPYKHQRLRAAAASAAAAAKSAATAAKAPRTAGAAIKADSATGWSSRLGRKWSIPGLSA